MDRLTWKLFPSARFDVRSTRSNKQGSLLSGCLVIAWGEEEIQQGTTQVLSADVFNSFCKAEERKFRRSIRRRDSIAQSFFRIIGGIEESCDVDLRGEKDSTHGGCSSGGELEGERCERQRRRKFFEGE